MSEKEGKSYRVPDKPGADDVHELHALTMVQANAAAMRERLQIGWLAGPAYTPEISETRREVERAVNSLQRALARYETAVNEKALRLRTRFAIWFDLNADDLESAVQEGRKEGAISMRPLLRDIALRLDEDADDEQDRMDAVSVQTEALQKRVAEALKVGDDE